MWTAAKKVALVVGMAVASILPTAADSREPVRATNLVAFYSGEAATPNNRALDQSLRDSFQVSPEGEIEFFSEYIDFARFDGNQQAQRLATYLGQRYAGK
jgi:hypothetical protein